MPDNCIRDALILKQIKFYHAMNLGGVAQYCRHGGILSREKLIEADSTHYTPFWSDAMDKKRGLLERVFGNLYDFGAIFARAGNSVPNIYGPILFQFSCHVFQEMTDIVVTPKTVANLGSDWRSKGIIEDTDVRRLLSGTAEDNYIKRGMEYSEVSCSNNVISFGALEKIIVDPLDVEGGSLYDCVHGIVANSSINVPVEKRHYSRLGNLSNLKQIATLLHAQKYTAVKPPSWVPEAKNGSFNLWMQYFQEDTIAYVRRETGRK